MKQKITISGQISIKTRPAYRMRSLNKKSTVFIALLTLLFAGAHAQIASSPAASVPATAAMADGEVRKVDKSAQKLTLRHGRIENLDMPGMTMVFKVADPKMLEGLTEGDKLRFSADRINGAITITTIQPAK